MKKRVWMALFMALTMTCSCLPAVAFAADEVDDVNLTEPVQLIENYLKNQHKDKEAGWNGNNWKDLEKADNPFNVTNVDKDDPEAHFSFWHFVDNSGGAVYAEISFEDEEGNPVDVTVDAQDGKHYRLVTPYGWKVVDCVSYSSASTDEVVLSHSATHEATAVEISVEADVYAHHKEITPYENYETTVTDVRQKTITNHQQYTVNNHYTYTVDNYYTQNVVEYWMTPVTDIYQRYAQRYLVPVFEPVMAGEYNGTLVTRLEYSDNTAKAKPTNGDAFKNGHTYVTVDVAEASKEGGVNFTIADSSKNNGKKTPAQYNRPIEYQYNVKIADGKLTVSCDKDMAYASVGAEIWDKAPKDFKNAPKHYDGSVTVDLPKNDGTVDVYVHFGSLGWYEWDDEHDAPAYKFKEWKVDNDKTEFGDYEVVDTVKGEPVFDHQENKGDKVLKESVKGPDVFDHAERTGPEVIKTDVDDVVVRTETSDPVLVKSWKDEKDVKDTYTGVLEVTVDGVERELGKKFTATLGEHTYTLSGPGFETVEGKFTVTSTTETVDLGTVEVVNDDVTLATVRSDKTVQGEDEYLPDIVNTVTEEDKVVDLPAVEGVVTDHEPEIVVVGTENFDQDPADKDYKEEYLYREDIKQGNETDPYNDFAIRL